MRISLRMVLLLFAMLYTHVSVRAQENCPKDFNEISPACIQSVSRPNLDKAITLSPELIGNIYFFKTPSGQLGKLKVTGVTVTPLECTLFLDASTFDGEKLFQPNSSLSISVENNHWLRGRMFLDKEGTAALEMERPRDDTNKVCKLQITKGSEILFYKKVSDLKVREENNLLFYGPLILVFIAIFIVVSTLR